MNELDFIAEELLAVRPDGTQFLVIIRVGRPYRDAPEDDPNDNTHACLVQCEGIDRKPLRIYGEGAMQALHLGLKAIKLHLECGEADGLRYASPQNGEPHDWRRFWYGDVRPAAG